MKKRTVLTTLISLGLLFGVTGCTSEASNVAQAQTLGEKEIEELNDSVNVQTSYYYLPVGTYDSADTAILKSIDKDEGKVTLYNTVAAKSYTLNYDGTTYVSDKYGTAMSMAQLSEGTIVNVNFFKATRQLVDIQVSPEAWSYESVTKYNLGGINSTALIGDRTYALTKGVQVFSQGEQTDVMNIVDGDAITVSGIGYDIYSIKVESGHGYVRLTNDEALVGGWIEIGNELITRVTEEQMLLAVPEGSYTVRMYNDTSSVIQDITVDRNQEVVLDCREITTPVDEYGRLIFHVTPENATLMLDGEYKDISGIIKTEYGIHQIEVSASGYNTLSRYINVGNELSEITINLDASVAYVSGNTNSWTDTTGTNTNGTGSNTTSGNSTSGNTVSGNTVSGNKSTKTTSGTNRVYVYSPTDVEVYVDGIYVGLSPLSFKKTAGSHTLILKKSGYETRSYTIYCYDDGNDMSISFSELEKVENDTSDKNSSDTDKKKDTDKKDSTDVKTPEETPKDETDTGSEEETGTNTDSDLDEDTNGDTKQETDTDSDSGGDGEEDSEDQSGDDSESESSKDNNGGPEDE